MAKLDTLSLLSDKLLPGIQNQTLEMPPPAISNAPEKILLLGWGKFMRGFVPDFVQSANAKDHYAGRILAVQRYTDYRSEAAAQQRGLYTLIARGLEQGRQVERKRIIGSVSRLLCADREWADVITAVQKPEMRVIVSNATETGLRIDSQDEPGSSPPQGFPGKLTRLLLERWQATGGNEADIAIIPTELVLDNGALVQRLILDQACAWHLRSGFIDWIRNSVHVASTLVDRIVVGTPTPDLLAKECRALGYRDDLLTCCEPYYLFAIEADDFTRQHFPLTGAARNVRYVEDLAPFRCRKLRLLNGPQMVLTTLGTLLDFRIVYQAVKDEQIGPFAEATVWEEIIPAMGTEEEAVNTQYARECLQRISNPMVEHRLQGIRVDLTTKNAIRLFPSIRDYISREKQLPKRLLLTVAATVAVALRIDLEDINAEYIRSRWSSVASRDNEPVLAFIHDVITRLSSSANEPLDVDVIAPEICAFFTQIQRDGLRSVLAQRSLRSSLATNP